MKYVWVVVFTLVAWSPSANAQEAAKAADAIPADDRLNAILWTMTSAEFEAACYMAFATAKAQLDAALADKTRSAALEQKGDFAALPPAIIMDIDETVLDNGPYQVELMRETKIRPADLMAQWVERAEAVALPGAKDFIAYAQSKGVTIFYITNRNAEKEEATRKNLAAVGATFPKDIDTVFLERERPEWRNDKDTRRAAAAATHRILLMLGDDFNDFVSVQRMTPVERRAAAEREAARWGRDWIIIPNPMYGSWENSAVNFQFRATPEERRRIKHDQIKGFQ
ncbi:MAG: HAD family acid phosphatase [Rhodospirillaceae bacterium]|nr:HAD family acid phosphatase [Rhodospirillaceae bacterium]